MARTLEMNDRPTPATRLLRRICDTEYETREDTRLIATATNEWFCCDALAIVRSGPHRSLEEAANVKRT